MLLIVRHAMPVPSPHSPPEEWTLAAEGEAAAHGLLIRLPSSAILVSSTERKAWETLSATGGKVARDARFDEVRRVAGPWDADFRRTRRRYVEGETPPGWERPEDVATRFEAGVVHWREVAGDQPLAIGTHGMTITTWLVGRGAVEREAAGDFWADLQFPDCFLVGRDGRSVQRYP